MGVAVMARVTVLVTEPLVIVHVPQEPLGVIFHDSPSHCALSWAVCVVVRLGVVVPVASGSAHTYPVMAGARDKFPMMRPLGLMATWRRSFVVSVLSV